MLAAETLLFTLLALFSAPKTWRVEPFAELATVEAPTTSEKTEPSTEAAIPSAREPLFSEPMRCVSLPAWQAIVSKIPTPPPICPSDTKAKI